MDSPNFKTERIFRCRIWADQCGPYHYRCMVDGCDRRLVWAYVYVTPPRRQGTGRQKWVKTGMRRGMALDDVCIFFILLYELLYLGVPFYDFI